MPHERSVKLPLRIALIGNLTACAIFGITAGINSERSSSSAQQEATCVAKGGTYCYDYREEASHADDLLILEESLGGATLCLAAFAAFQLRRRNEGNEQTESIIAI